MKCAASCRQLRRFLRSAPRSSRYRGAAAARNVADGEARAPPMARLPACGARMSRRSALRRRSQNGRVASVGVGPAGDSMTPILVRGDLTAWRTTLHGRADSVGMMGTPAKVAALVCWCTSEQARSRPVATYAHPGGRTVAGSGGDRNAAGRRRRPPATRGQRRRFLRDDVRPSRRSAARGSIRNASRRRPRRSPAGQPISRTVPVVLQRDEDLLAAPWRTTRACARRPDELRGGEAGRRRCRRGSSIKIEADGHLDRHARSVRWSFQRIAGRTAGVPGLVEGDPCIWPGNGRYPASSK